jgi:hypothetical protein
VARGKKESRVRIFHTSLDRRPTIPAEPAPKRACDLSLHEAVPLEFRARLLKPRAARLELHNTFFEWSDEWIEPDGTVFDLIYRSCDLIEAVLGERSGIECLRFVHRLPDAEKHRLTELIVSRPFRKFHSQTILHPTALLEGGRLPHPR